MGFRSSRPPLTAAGVLLVAVALSCCGGARTPTPAQVTSGRSSTPSATAGLASTTADRAPHRLRRAAAPRPGRAADRRRPTALRTRVEALVTAESENRLLVIDVTTGRVLERLAIPGGPQYVAAQPGFAIVTSPGDGTVSLLSASGARLRVVRVLHSFGGPRIVELTPDGQHALVTDDQRGTLTVIPLTNRPAPRTIDVGASAHHLALSPDQRRVWVALGEAARRIVIVDTGDLLHPRVVSGFDPGFAAHDLAFSPDGTRVWITSASGPDVSVFRASDHRLLFRVPVGPGPQHIAFDGTYAYLTSGYGSSIERVVAATGHVVARASAPYGSFELDARDGYVVTASLLDGRLAVYTPALHLLRERTLAPATRDVALTLASR